MNSEAKVLNGDIEFHVLQFVGAMLLVLSC